MFILRKITVEDRYGQNRWPRIGSKLYRDIFSTLLFVLLRIHICNAMWPREDGISPFTGHMSSELKSFVIRWVLKKRPTYRMVCLWISSELFVRGNDTWNDWSSLGYTIYHEWKRIRRLKKMEWLSYANLNHAVVTGKIFSRCLNSLSLIEGKNGFHVYSIIHVLDS